jgi:hypothetical protein
MFVRRRGYHWFSEKFLDRSHSSYGCSLAGFTEDGNFQGINPSLQRQR